MNGRSCKLPYLVEILYYPFRLSSFLRHISRVAAPDYLPTTGEIHDIWHAYINRVPADDILHARIQTMGVAEHVFDVNIHGKLVTWHLYDVGGARGQRHTWVPYFDDANAIIFVAPVSAFDQVRCYPMLLRSYDF